MVDENIGIRPTDPDAEADEETAPGTPATALETGGDVVGYSVRRERHDDDAAAASAASAARTAQGSGKMVGYGVPPADEHEEGSSMGPQADDDEESTGPLP